MKSFFSAAIFFVLLLMGWEVLVRLRWYSPILVPSPISVAQYLQSAVANGTLWPALWVTLNRLLLGYFFGGLLRLPLGMITARYRVMIGIK